MSAETTLRNTAVDDEQVVAEEAPATTAKPADAASASERGGDRSGAQPQAGAASSAHSADDEAIATLIAERDDYLDALRRLQAEFDNFRKRVRREQEDEFARAVAWTVDRLLPALDAFDGAKRHHPEVVEPLESVLHGALVAVGVERIEPVGEAFDPDSHDAVAYDDPEQTDELTIVEVLRAGYRCRGRLVRPAMVRVGHPTGASEE